MVIRAKIYPFWADLFNNNTWFYTDDLTFCDNMYWNWQLFKVVLDWEVGIKACEVGAYDNFLASSNDSWRSCFYEWTYLHDLVDTRYDGQFNRFFGNECPHQYDYLQWEKSDEPVPEPESVDAPEEAEGEAVEGEAEGEVPQDAAQL